MLLAGAAEVREGPWGNDACEGVERGPLPGVIEGHLASVHVQDHPDHLGRLAHDQGLPRRGAGLVLIVTKTDSPEALGRGQNVLPLPVDGVTGHAHHPVGVVLDVDVPAVASGAEALGAEHLGAFVEALGVVREIEDMRAGLQRGEVL